MMMRKSLLHIAITLVVFTLAAPAQERYVKFIDEAPKDPSLITFRKKLLNVIKRRDLRGLEAMLDPQIKVSFGGDEGIKDFRRYWQVNDPRTKLWQELELVISNGGAFIDGSNLRIFAAPYSFLGFPEDLDAFSHSVIFGNAVALRGSPSLEGQVLTRLSYNIVTIDGEKTVTVEDGEHSVPQWYFVRTLGGQAGYVSAKYVRSPLDYRLTIDKRRGTWRISGFVAGD